MHYTLTYRLHTVLPVLFTPDFHTFILEFTQEDNIPLNFNSHKVITTRMFIQYQPQQDYWIRWVHFHIQKKITLLQALNHSSQKTVQLQTQLTFENDHLKKKRRKINLNVDDWFYSPFVNFFFSIASGSTKVKHIPLVNS